MSDTTVPTPTIKVVEGGGGWVVELHVGGAPVIGVIYEPETPGDPTLVVWGPDGEAVDDAHVLPLASVIDAHLDPTTAD